MSTSLPLVVADRYRLVAPLGQGGMGRVWRATDVVLHRDVAIKELVPPPGLTAEERQEMRERSLREARAIARLNNVNVVRVFDVLRTDADPWIVMEYVPSRSLQDTLASDGPYPPLRAAEIGLGVLNALRAAHRNGVVHRDVKPGNVLIGEDGRVVLTDFGLATVPGDPNVTRTGLVLGSPAYISPERARDGTAGPGSDLWSLGATLYAAVEGASPFARSSAIATLAALATENPPPARNAGPLKPVLNGLLRKDPAHRINAEEAERLLLRASGRRSRLSFPMSPTMRRPGVGRERPALPGTLPVVPGASSPTVSGSAPVVPGPRPPIGTGRPPLGTARPPAAAAGPPVPPGRPPAGDEDRRPPIFAPGKASVGRPPAENPTRADQPRIDAPRLDATRVDTPPVREPTINPLSGTRTGAPPDMETGSGPTPPPAQGAPGALSRGTRGAFGTISAAEIAAHRTRTRPETPPGATPVVPPADSTAARVQAGPDATAPTAPAPAESDTAAADAERRHTSGATPTAAPAESAAATPVAEKLAAAGSTADAATSVTDKRGASGTAPGAAEAAGDAAGSVADERSASGTTPAAAETGSDTDVSVAEQLGPAGTALTTASEKVDAVAATPIGGGTAGADASIKTSDADTSGAATEPTAADHAERDGTAEPTPSVPAEATSPGTAAAGAATSAAGGPISDAGDPKQPAGTETAAVTGTPDADPIGTKAPGDKAEAGATPATPPVGARAGSKSARKKGRGRAATPAKATSGSEPAAEPADPTTVTAAAAGSAVRTEDAKIVTLPQQTPAAAEQVALAPADTKPAGTVPAGTPAGTTTGAAAGAAAATKAGAAAATKTGAAAATATGTTSKKAAEPKPGAASTPTQPKAPAARTAERKVSSGPRTPAQNTKAYAPPSRPAWQPMTVPARTEPRGITVLGTTLTRRQTTIGAVVLAVLLLAMILLVPRAFGGDDDNASGTTPVVPPQSAAATSAAPTSAAAVPPAAGEAPSNAPSSAPPSTSTPPSSAPAAALPRGWYPYTDPTGFSVPLPNGWKPRRQGTEVYFQGTGNRLLIIDQTDSPKSDPVADWEGQEAQRRGSTYRDYQRIRIDAVDYFQKAADWEFTYRTGSGNPQHAQKRGFIVSSNKAYGISFYTSPGDWDANKAVLETIYQGFKPAGS